MDQPNSEAGETKNGTIRAYLGGISIALSAASVLGGVWAFVIMVTSTLGGAGPQYLQRRLLVIYGTPGLAVVGLALGIVGVKQEGHSSRPTCGIVLNAVLLIIGLWLIIGS